MRRAALALVALLAGCGGSKPSTGLTRDQLLDPTSCASCHPNHYSEWASSMHAYAADDPVFRAMNARGQRETNGALGSFCVKCHAPMAVREGATVDGLNLDTVDPKLKGVTCFFCHSVDSVQGAHDAPLHLATDGALRASISDPASTAPHGAMYGNLQDRNQLASATMCGACHDIVTPHGAAIERTFAEWSASAFNASPNGTTCGQCHMSQDPNAAPIAPGGPARHRHAHTFAAVDLRIANDGGADQSQLVQDFLDSSIQSALCVRTFGGFRSRIELILDNVAAGHGFPSGSAQDRRFWADVRASARGQPIYASGDVSDGGSVEDLSDAWVMRDCMFGDGGAPVHMFWEAASAQGNELPALATFDSSDPRYYQSHIARYFPPSNGHLSTQPDTVTAQLHLRAVGDDVLADLAASGDLDPSTAARIPTFDVGPTLTWTSATANVSFFDSNTQELVSCVTNGVNPQSTTVEATDVPNCR